MAEYIYGFVPFEEIPEFKMVRREEVVRCRDCKRFSVDNSDHDYRSGWWCKRWNTDMVKPDGFCAWACRKKGGRMTPTQIARRSDALYADGTCGMTRRVLCDMVAQRESDLEDARDENAKLRELVRDYERCTMHADCSMCEYDGKLSTHCPFSPCFPDADELRELGVEVDE